MSSYNILMVNRVHFKNVLLISTRKRCVTVYLLKSLSCQYLLIILIFGFCDKITPVFFLIACQRHTFILCSYFSRIAQKRLVDPSKATCLSVVLSRARLQIY